MVLQPLFTQRWYVVRRAQAIRAIEKSHETRVITMIHRQEKRSLFGFPVSRHIDLEDAQTIIAAIKDTPDDMPIDLVIHTPGGIVLAAMQIARAVEAHKAKVTVYVPVYAMSGGTLIALAADEIVMGESSVLSIRRLLGFRPRASSKPATRSPSRVSSISRWFSLMWRKRD
jgi:ClpP class serine protease